jgi:hypothetical protein
MPSSDNERRNQIKGEKERMIEDTIIYYIIGVIIGAFIGIGLFLPFIGKLDNWWIARNTKPFFDEPVKERMEMVAELMLRSTREARGQRGKRRLK